MTDMLRDIAITSSILRHTSSSDDVPVEPSQTVSPILVCRGHHAGVCGLLERNGISGVVGGDHGLVVELDVHVPEHRAFLGTLRSSISDETALVVLPRIGNRTVAAC